MSSVYSVDSCAVCGGELRSTGAVSWRTLKAKGLESLEKFASLDGNSELCRYLASHPAIVNVHDSCHSRYTDKRRLEKLPGSVSEESKCWTFEMSRFLAISGRLLTTLRKCKRHTC